MFHVHFRVLAIASLIALAGCQQPEPPGEAPSGVAVEPGDGRVTVTWNQQPGLTYWIFFQIGSSVSPTTQGAAILRDVVSPQVLFNFANGTQYAFVMNASKGDSAAGPASPVVVATPRLAGVNWASGAALSTANLNGMAFNGSRFVAVGDMGTVFAGDHSYTSISPPGVSAWMPPTSLPPGFTSNLSAVTYTGQFVALGTDGSILTSSDGLTWALAANPVPGTGMNAIAFGPGLHVAAGSGGNIFTSPDLITWTQATSNTVNDLYSVSFLNGGFVATGANGTLVTSPDGVTWTVQVSNTASALRSAAFRALPARYVAVGDAGAIVTSADGVAWNLITPPPLAQNLSSVVFGSRFVAVGQGGAVAFSDDGTNWTQASAGSANLTRVLFAPAMYIAVGAAGANVVSK